MVDEGTIDPVVLQELETMARNCSGILFDRIMELNLVNNTDLMIRLYRLCPQNSSNQTISFWEEVAPALIVYTLTFLLGVIGNLLIVVAVFGYKRMKSSTNIFLASLAIADLLFCLICIPVKLAKLFSFSWTLGYFNCKFITYLEIVLAVSSALNLTGMSMERCYAIRYPLKARSVCTNNRAQKSVAFLWILSLILSTPILYVQVHKKVGLVEIVYWCTRDEEQSFMWPLHEIYVFCVILLIPGVIMSVSYGLVALEMWRCLKERKNLSAHFVDPSLASRQENESQVSRRNIGNGKFRDRQMAVEGEEDVSTILLPSNRGEILEMDPIGDGKHDSQIKSPCIKLTYQGTSRNQYQVQKIENREKTIQVVRMLVAIVVVFVVCWTPLLIIHILQSLDVIKLQIQGWAKHGKTVSSLLAYLNSALNPIIYGFMSHNFRDSFKKAMASLFHPISKRIWRVKRSQSGNGPLNEIKPTPPLGRRVKPNQTRQASTSSSQRTNVTTCSSDKVTHRMTIRI